ncbi:MAG: methylated-DNA--[protein]-cysteine S-methyltransferase [Candidatus Nomurabacteria bacterium]|jgi:methylated-DNA-[protein]-cysteine S-methyltransferase|nr:methylated-DNA--[protein]-cysteine S-methyltransferase [Candidatus Nomurabacteria bacterium]
MKLSFLDNYPVLWRKEVEEYLRGERREFSEAVIGDVKNTMAGTEFQKAVWRAMMGIPYSEVLSYEQLATLVGRPKACRAAANACGKNPYPIIVPCHRVVASGGLGGFSLGLNLKRRLLGLEGVNLTKLP